MCLPLQSCPFINESERKGRDVPAIAQDMDKLEEEKALVEKAIAKLNDSDPLTLDEKEKIVKIASSEDYESIKNIDDVTSENLPQIKEEISRDLDSLANKSAAEYLPNLPPRTGYP